MAPFGFVSRLGEELLEFTGFDDRFSRVLNRQIVQLHEQHETTDPPPNPANRYGEMSDKVGRGRTTRSRSARGSGVEALLQNASKELLRTRRL